MKRKRSKYERVNEVFMVLWGRDNSRGTVCGDRINIKEGNICGLPKQSHYIHMSISRLICKNAQDGMWRLDAFCLGDWGNVFIATDYTEIL